MTKQLIPLFLAGLMAVAVAPTASATPIILGNVINGGGFTTDAQFDNWIRTGTVNRRLATDTINTSGGNAGFVVTSTDAGGLTTNTPFFTSAFATLGDTANLIGDEPDSGISTLSQTFTLAEMITESTVQSYDLRIRFRTVFDGQDDGTSILGADIFRATLSSVALSSEIVLFSQNSNPLPSGAPDINTVDNQRENDQFNRLYTGLLPGTYTLTFSLNESASTADTGGFTNTAAGVDAVSVNATANLVPEPSTLALVGAALVGLALRRRRA